MAQGDTDRIYDEYLVTLVRAGDGRAAERLAARWYPRLLRTARRARHSGLDETAEPASPARSEMRYALDQAFERLSPDHRIAAILYFSEGLTLSEVAAATGVPVGTAKSRIFHARKHLKSTLEGDV
jgi:RNA polymerase sigma-70 factor (ECF subfamily)